MTGSKYSKSRIEGNWLNEQEYLNSVAIVQMPCSMDFFSKQLTIINETKDIFKLYNLYALDIPWDLAAEWPWPPLNRSFFADPGDDGEFLPFSTSSFLYL